MRHQIHLPVPELCEKMWLFVYSRDYRYWCFLCLILVLLLKTASHFLAVGTSSSGVTGAWKSHELHFVSNHVLCISIPLSLANFVTETPFLFFISNNLRFCFVIAFLSYFSVIFTLDSWTLTLIVTDTQHSVVELTLRHVCFCFFNSHIPVFALGLMQPCVQCWLGLFSYYWSCRSNNLATCLNL